MLNLKLEKIKRFCRQNRKALGVAAGALALVLICTAITVLAVRRHRAALEAEAAAQVETATTAMTTTTEPTTIPPTTTMPTTTEPPKRVVGCRYRTFRIVKVFTLQRVVEEIAAVVIETRASEANGNRLFGCAVHQPTGEISDRLRERFRSDGDAVLGHEHLAGIFH